MQYVIVIALVPGEIHVQLIQMVYKMRHILPLILLMEQLELEKKNNKTLVMESQNQKCNKIIYIYIYIKYITLLTCVNKKLNYKRIFKYV